ncbi:MAG TPA: hypothetical protein VFD87_19480, partial [Phototrophicaceae bacterium]|nr:hypothetical protein [Phototrophicaceae bacterium]
GIILPARKGIPRYSLRATREIGLLIVVCNGPVSTNERRVFVLALGMSLTSFFPLHRSAVRVDSERGLRY